MYVLPARIDPRTGPLPRALSCVQLRGASLILVTAPAEQLLTGFQLAETRCNYCKTTLQEGDPISAYAVRYAGDESWCVLRLYCHTCRATIEEPTLGASELLAEGRLGLTMDATTQRTSLTLLGIERVIHSEPEKGHVTL